MPLQNLNAVLQQSFDLTPGIRDGALPSLFAIGIALIVMLLALFVKWGQSPAAAPIAQPRPTLLRRGLLESATGFSRHSFASTEKPLNGPLRPSPFQACFR